MAEHTESEPTQWISTSSAYNKIPLLQGMENYSKGAAHMQFYLGGIQSSHLIEEDPPRGFKTETSARRTRSELDWD